MRHNDRVHQVGERPPDPTTFLSDQEQQESVQKLLEWWKDKQKVLCLTGAGISTESNIPDYRGHKGSYHRGHKPIIHDQFTSSDKQRQRYWGRSLAGWKSFDQTTPNDGHHALALLEKMGKVGVEFSDRSDFYSPEKNDSIGDDQTTAASNGRRRLALITQNVDSLHSRAGSIRLIEIHGKANRVKCMSCGHHTDRNSYHSQLESLNSDWVTEARAQLEEQDLRADGDAEVRQLGYDLEIPGCQQCGNGFYKPDVVFFGDSVPKWRVAQCHAAVQNSDGLLVVGSSLAVHSAFQYVRAADKQGIPIAILNIGETRAQAEGIKALHIEAPAGPTLRRLVNEFQK